MKTIFTFLILLFSLASFGQDTIKKHPGDTEVYLHGQGSHPVYYLNGSDEPFTGVFVEYDRRGFKRYQQAYKNGQPHGAWIDYRVFAGDCIVIKETTYQNGEFRREIEYSVTGEIVSDRGRNH